MSKAQNQIEQLCFVFRIILTKNTKQKKMTISSICVVDW